MADDRRLPPQEGDPKSPTGAEPVREASTGGAARGVDGVLARFTETAALDQAIVKLESAGFSHEDLGLPEVDPTPEQAAADAGSASANSDVDAQQRNVFGSAVGGSAAAMAAAAVTAATGGVAVAIAGAAVGAGAAIAGAAHLLTKALGSSEQRGREQKAKAGNLVLAVRTTTAEKRERAKAVLRESGGALL